MGDDPGSIDFALREAMRLLSHGALVVRNQAYRVMTNLAMPLASLLSAVNSQDDDTRTLIRKHQQPILENVFVPLVQRGEAGHDYTGALSPLMRELVHEHGATLFSSYPALCQLVTWEACRSLEAKDRKNLVYTTMEGYAQQASGGTPGSRVYLPNRDKEEPTTALIVGLGPQGILAAFQYATEFMRSGNRVGALAVRLAAARAAQSLPEAERSPVQETAAKVSRPVQAEFQRMREFLMEEIDSGRLPYRKTPELNRVVGTILEKGLRESLLGSSEVYHSGDEELHLAVEVLAAHARKGESDPHQGCRRFLACWFKVFPPAERHRHVRVTLDHALRVLEAVVQGEGDSEWAAKAVYLLTSKLDAQLQSSRNSSDALRQDVTPLFESLSRCVAVIGPEREVSFQKSGVVQQHNVRAVAFRVLEEVRRALKPQGPGSSSEATLERIPRVPFEFHPGSRVHVPGLSPFRARIEDSSAAGR